MKNLLKDYKKNKTKIKSRLKEFERFRKSGIRKIFPELCFCLLTPQAKAISCDRAVKELKSSGLLFKGSKREVKSKLKNVRFPNNKSLYLVSARKFLAKSKNLDIKNVIDARDSFKAREWLVENVKGLGYKEASHFLRNVGSGRDIAILDVHILRNLKNLKVINAIPSSISRKKYLAIEAKMKRFAKKIGIPVAELDLLFWSKETGFIFK